jgi:DNA mismatch repair ATPase MutS
VVAKNGLVYLVKSPTEEGAVQGVEYFRPYDDKKHKRLGGYTSQGVTEALDEYKSHVERAPRVVEKVLQGLCEKLDDYQMTVVLISNWALILQATSSHVIAARRKGWSLPSLDDFHEESYVAGEDAGLPRPVFEVNGLSAWWMERGDSSTKLNQVSLDGLFLLTAPNMSGKSTIMRSVLAAALLANAGLFVPCDEGARIPAYDSFFLRTSSYDVPSEGKSSFALEMDDMRVVLRDSTT